eukprot:gene11633-8020_t
MEALSPNDGEAEKEEEKEKERRKRVCSSVRVNGGPGLLVHTYESFAQMDLVDIPPQRFNSRQTSAGRLRENRLSIWIYLIRETQQRILGVGPTRIPWPRQNGDSFSEGEVMANIIMVDAYAYPSDVLFGRYFWSFLFLSASLRSFYSNLWVLIEFLVPVAQVPSPLDPHLCFALCTLCLLPISGLRHFFFFFFFFCVSVCVVEESTPKSTTSIVNYPTNKQQQQQQKKNTIIQRYTVWTRSIFRILDLGAAVCLSPFSFVWISLFTHTSPPIHSYLVIIIIIIIIIGPSPSLFAPSYITFQTLFFSTLSFR